MDSTMTEMLLSTSRQVTPACHSYHAEVHALILGLEVTLSYLRFNRLQPRPTRLAVLTDSRSILTHLESISTRLRPLVYGPIRTIINLVTTLSSTIQVELVWIPGHVGIAGNEEADKQAGIGRRGTFAIGDSYPTSMLRAYIRDLRTDRLDQYLTHQSTLWTQKPERKGFLDPMQSPPDDPTRQRQTDVTLFRLYAGHTNTRDHWSRLGFEVETDRCRYCKTSVETAEHLVMKCPKVWRRADRESLDDLLVTYRSMTNEVATLSGVLKYREGPIFDALVRTVDDMVERGVRL